jgi:hypothetical protein
MKRIFTLMAMVSCILMDVQAQLNPPLWSKNYGGDAWERAQIVRTVGSDIVVAGASSSDSHDFAGLAIGNSDIFLMKLDPLGNIYWAKFYGGSRGEQCNGMEPTADGGFILVGAVDSDDGDAYNNGYHMPDDRSDEWMPDFWVVKTDSSGNIEWSRAFGGKDFDEAWKVRQTDDNGDGIKDDGYIVVGRTLSNDGDVMSGNRGLQDTWVIKLSATGELQWERTLGGSNNEFGRDVEQTPDGGFIVLSYTASDDKDVEGLHDDQNTGGRLYIDMWIVKLDASGSDIEWSRTFGGNYQDMPYEMILTDDDGDGEKDDAFIIVGETESTNGDLGTQIQGSYDLVVAKFDFEGEELWQQRMGGSDVDRGISIVQTHDGGYAVLGSTRSIDKDLAAAPSKGEHDFMLVKLAANGSPQYLHTWGGSFQDEAWSITQGPEGCFVMAGRTVSNDYDVPGLYGWDDIWVLNWCPPPPSHLPVTITDFKAQYQGNGKAILKWSTASEQNNDRFEIQRSVDGQNFNTIGTVSGSGTSSHTLTYAYIDQGVDALNAEVVYYRLRQVDIDGKSELSQVVMVRPAIQNGADVRVWPNPSEGRFQVQLKNAPSGPVKATIYSASGKVIKTTTFRNVTSEIDLSGQSAGTYFIRLEDNKGWMQVQPVIVK